MLSLGYDDYAFIICWILMLLYEVFIKSPKQTSRQDVKSIAKNANLLNNGTPNGNEDKASPSDTTTKNSQFREKASPMDTSEEVSPSDQTACPKDKHENAEVPSPRYKAKMAVPAQSDHGPGITHTKLKKGKKSKTKAVEISPASTTGLKSKPKADNKINKRSKGVANVRACRETSKERNVKNSKSKKRSRSTSPSPLPRRPPTKLYESSTSSSEPDDKKLDLHGYTVEEAIHEFAQFYLKTKEIYRLKMCEEEDRYIYVVTGRGNGCRDGKPKIRPAVQRLLDKYDIRHNWRNERGLVMIDFCEQDEEEKEEEDPVTLKTRDKKAKRKDKKRKGRNRNKKGKPNFYSKMH
ncbi:unnamed protein product [Lymnaea stagnalis]|uniref:Smr domain-containing protein n=1 Tax=Lymnaea stagnalis TaxID=6523 RepID=A0AAV2I634_LYMST